MTKLFSSMRLTYIIGLFLMALSIGLYPEVVERSFKYPPIQYPPVYYNNQFYIYDASQALVKVSLSGHEEWRINFENKIRSFQVKFDKIFVVDHLNQLSCYDADYGYQLWGPYKYNVTNLYVKYPLGVYLTKQGHIAAFDFFSGQRIWKNASLKGSSLFDLSINNQVFFSSEGRLNRLDMYSGKVNSYTKTTLSIDRILEGDNRLVIVDTKKQIYYYEQSKNLIRKLKKYSNLDLMDQYQVYFLFQDTALNQGIVKNIESNETVFSLPLENAVDFQFVGPFSDYLVVQKKDHVDFFEVAQTNDILSEEETSKTEEDDSLTTIYGASGNLMKSFFVDDKVFLFYSEKLLVWQAE